MEDPGPPPDSLVVRAEREGFYARVWPKPVLPARRIAGAAVGIAALSIAVALATGSDPWLRAEVGACVALFVGLLSLFSIGPGFVPVEIAVDDHAVNWGGERFPLPVVADCVVRDRVLELVGAEGRALARIDGVDAAAARWLSLAIKASLPVRS
jgi:hypothetical protein